MFMCSRKYARQCNTPRVRWSQRGTRLVLGVEFSPGVSVVVAQVPRWVPDFHVSHQIGGRHHPCVPLADEFRPSRDPRCLTIHSVSEGSEKQQEFEFRTYLVRPMLHPVPVDVRQPGMFHDLAGPVESEPVLWVESQQPRDQVFEAVPQNRLLRPLVIQRKDILEYAPVTVLLEWLDAKTHIKLDNLSEAATMNNCGWW